MRKLVRWTLIAVGCFLFSGSFVSLIFVQGRESALRALSKRQPLEAKETLQKQANAHAEQVEQRSSGCTPDSVRGVKRHNENITLSVFVADSRFTVTHSKKAIWLGDGSLLLRDFKTADYISVTVGNVEALKYDKNRWDVSKKMFLSEKVVSTTIKSPYHKIDFNYDANFAAIYVLKAKVYRHSNKYTIKIMKLIRKKSENDPKLERICVLDDVQLFEWSPRGTDFVYIKNNRLYHSSDVNDGIITEIVTPKRNYSNASSLDSNWNHSEGLNEMRSEEFVFSGIADWIYEEEIFGSSKAFWWSQAGEHLAFARFDDSNVTKTRVLHYDYLSTLPRISVIPYPKTGTPNLPRVSLWIWSKRLKATVMIKPPDEVANSEKGFYLFSANWAPTNEQLLSVWANREQNFIVISACGVINDTVFLEHKTALNCKTLLSLNYTLASGMPLWAEPLNLKLQHFSDDGFFVVVPDAVAMECREASSNDLRANFEVNSNIYDAVAHVEIQNGKITALHGADYDILSIVGYDRRNDILFLTAGSKLVDGKTHLYRIPTAAGASGLPLQCVSCLKLSVDRAAGTNNAARYDDKNSIKKADKNSVDADYAHIDDVVDDDGCALANVQFSPDSTNFLMECARPFYAERKFFLKNSENIAESVKLDEILPLNKRAVSVATPKMRFLTVATSQGNEAYVRILYPAWLKFDKREKHDGLLPLILYVYGGPNSALSLYDTPRAVFSYLTAVKDALVVTVDGRGAARHGWRMRAPLRGNFGSVEIDDQIEVLRHLISTYSGIIDPKRVAVFGWSYGGFASLSIAKRDAGNTVKCVASVAPVTDFRHYDAAYTERYMGLLANADDKARYERSSLIARNASDFMEVFREKVKLFLAHGIADDNVHYDSSALFAEQLQRQNIHFTQLVYANQDHTLSNTIMHFYMELLRFFDVCWAA